MENINNKVCITGKIVSSFELSHEVYGEKFYIFNVSVERLSGCEDLVPILISERMIDVNEEYVGKYISITGEFRSFNKHDSDKNKLVLNVFVTEYSFIDAVVKGGICNQIELCGYICKTPKYRKTPLGREIADLLIVVNRNYNKSDYIPCIVWGRNARFVSGFDIGSKIKICGRIQSREYQKHISDDETETRVAYEVSVSKIELVEEN